MSKKIFILFFFTISLASFSQADVQLSTFSKVSIITSGPGDALYEKFGHTAIRIKDSVLNFDFIYNYGIFDLDESNFYVNFTKGFMKYKLVKYPFYYALKTNQEEKRWAKEQILNLTTGEKNKFFYLLEKNASPKNASYFYDPFFNNCATKPRDIIQQVLGNKLIFSDDFIRKPMSLRQLMNKEINPNTWGSLGINIALGSKLDKIATTNEYLYLPDYVLQSLNTSKIKVKEKEEVLISQENILLTFKEKQAKSDTPSPFLTLSILFLVGIFVTYKDYKYKTRTKWFDFSLFFITGVFGVLIIFLWFFTNHSTAPNNFNFLWAFAPNLLIAFFLLKENPPKWIQKYSLIVIVLLLSIPIIWLFKIQLFTYPILPLLLLLVIRYVFLYKKLCIASS